MNTKLLYTIYAYVHTFTYTISDQKIIYNSRKGSLRSPPARLGRIFWFHAQAHPKNYVVKTDFRALRAQGAHIANY